MYFQNGIVLHTFFIYNCSDGKLLCAGIIIRMLANAARYNANCYPWSFFNEANSISTQQKQITSKQKLIMRRIRYFLLPVFESKAELLKHVISRHFGLNELMYYKIQPLVHKNSSVRYSDMVEFYKSKSDNVLLHDNSFNYIQYQFKY
jgi:predicted GTPase